MDDTKLAVGGHSFGGITAVKTAFLDKRVKACLAFDPWLYLHESDILKGTLKLAVPFISVNSEYFAEICHFDIWECLKVLVTNSSRNDNPTRSVKIKNMYHAH